jgi:hypothetical protein
MARAGRDAMRLAPGIRRIYDAEILFGDPP